MPICTQVITDKWKVRTKRRKTSHLHANAPHFPLHHLFAHPSLGRSRRCWGIKRGTYEFRQVSSGRDEVVCLLHRTQTFIYSQIVGSQTLTAPRWADYPEARRQQMDTQIKPENTIKTEMQGWQEETEHEYSLINYCQAVLIGILTHFCKMLRYLYFKIWFEINFSHWLGIFLLMQVFGTCRLITKRNFTNAYKIVYFCTLQMLWSRFNHIFMEKPHNKH